ncbi:HAD-IB family hydrolase [Viscerimonas tarda]
MENDKRTIAAFDFDGTITTKDTLFDFIAFYRGKFRLFVGLFILSPILSLFILKLIKNSTAKQILFSYFFKGEKIADFEQVCRDYSSRIAEIGNESTLERLRWHQQQNHQVVVVSASIDRWIIPWAGKMNISTVIGTTIEVKDDTITGRFLSDNCYGKEKVTRLSALFPDRENYTLYAYGNSSGDKELLEFSDFPTLTGSKL